MSHMAHQQLTALCGACFSLPEEFFNKLLGSSWLLLPAAVHLGTWDHNRRSRVNEATNFWRTLSRFLVRSFKLSHYRRGVTQFFGRGWHRHGKFSPGADRHPLSTRSRDELASIFANTNTKQVEAVIHKSAGTVKGASWRYGRSGVALLSSPLDGSSPSEQEKVAAAKRAPVGQKDPVERSLDGVSDANASKIDRSAIRTACGQHHSTLISSMSKRPFLPRCLSQRDGYFEMTARSQVRWAGCHGRQRGDLLRGRP